MAYNKEYFKLIATLGDPSIPGYDSEKVAKLFHSYYSNLSLHTLMSIPGRLQPRLRLPLSLYLCTEHSEHHQYRMWYLLRGLMS